MTTTNHTTTQLTPQYRKALSHHQLEVLQLLWRFRFASATQVAEYQGKPSGKFIQKRLKILEDQGFVAKRYDKSYRLQGKPAAYYLTPKGARTVNEHTVQKPDESINIKRIYKDKVLSERFITHAKNILDIFLALTALYPTKGKFEYFTKAQLSFEHYDQFPSPLQDAYIHIKTSTGTKHFFLDIFADSEPFFMLIRRIKNYLKYTGSGDWVTDTTNDTSPIILLVVESESVHKRLRKRIAYELNESFENLEFATTRLEYVTKRHDTGKVWYPIDEDGDDPDEQIQPKTLLQL